MEGIRDTCIKLHQASQHAARRIATAITSTVRLVLPPDLEMNGMMHLEPKKNVPELIGSMYG